MKKKKVMLLGAGEGQMPFFNICKNKGYQVIVVSIPGNYPCFELADKSYYVDTRDKEKILEIAQKEKIDAILTDQTDVSVPTVAFVAEKLGLRGIGYETSSKFTNKYLMRKAAQEAGVNVPEFGRASDLTEAISISKKIGFPLMIKPVDSSGSRGVIKINNLHELKLKYNIAEKYSTDNSVLLEQFIDGREYLVDGFAMNNCYINLDLGVKDYFDIPNIFVSKMCMFSSATRIHDRIGLKVLECNKRLVEKMGLEFGITHAEYLYNEINDKVYLVEIAARGGGVYLSSDITPLATGFNSNETLIDYVVEGKSIDINKLSLNQDVSAWVCFAFPEGEIKSIDGVNDLKSIDGVYKILLNDVYVGKKTKTLCDDSEKYGPIIVYAHSEEECYRTIEQIKDILDIKIDTKNGLENLIW